MQPHAAVRLWSHGCLPVFGILLVLFVPAKLGNASPPSHPSPCRMHYASDSQVEWECRRLKKGETLEHLFGDRWQDVARFNRIDRRHVYLGLPLKIPMRLEDIAQFTPVPPSYPPAEREAKFILVDLSEQFLAVYEYGRLMFSAPVTTGERGNETPAGEFRITAADPHHHSTLYVVEDTQIPYPMHYALRFHTTRQGVSYWIHGRDLPGSPASHGCIGLYDEAMQNRQYGYPRVPALEDAKMLFEWVVGSLPDDGELMTLKNGPRILIVGRAPETTQPGEPR